MSQLAEQCAAEQQHRADDLTKLRAAVREAAKTLGAEPDDQGGWTLRCAGCGDERTITASGRFYGRGSTSKCKALAEVNEFLWRLKHVHGVKSSDPQPL
jgi:hypothetical protein